MRDNDLCPEKSYVKLMWLVSVLVFRRIKGWWRTNKQLEDGAHNFSRKREYRSIQVVTPVLHGFRALKDNIKGKLTW